MVVVVLVTPSLTYVLFGSLRQGVSVTDKASQLPGYLSDTFLHLDFGYAPRFHKPRGQVLLDTMPVDIALLTGSLVCGVAIGLAAGLIGGARRRSAADRALAVGSAIGMSMPVYWFSSIALVLFAPQSGYLLQIPFMSWYGGYVPFADSPLRWLQSLWVPWLVLAAPLAAMVYRMTRASLAEALDEDFIRTARAKGLRERIVVRRHALRAALSPVIGLVSVNVALLVTNVIVIERAFNLPGFFRVASIGQFNGGRQGAPYLGRRRPGADRRGVAADRADDVPGRRAARQARPAGADVSARLARLPAHGETWPTGTPTASSVADGRSRNEDGLLSAPATANQRRNPRACEGSCHGRYWARTRWAGCSVEFGATAPLWRSEVF